MAKTPTDVRSLARSYTDMALQALAGIAQNGTSESARVAAAEAILSRGWGKPPQAITGGDEEDSPIKLLHRIERVIVNTKDSDS